MTGIAFLFVAVVALTGVAAPWRPYLDRSMARPPRRRAGYRLVRLLTRGTTWRASLLGARSSARRRLSKRDGQGPVAVTVTLVEAPATGNPVKIVKIKVSLETHSVALDGIKFEDVVAMGGRDGTAIAPTAVEQAEGAGHHREAVLAFPPLPAGTREVRIAVRNVGGVGERNFAWDLSAGR